MSKIRVLPDNLANQIAAGEVVERPSSVAKELVENAIDAGARRIETTIEAGGRRILRVVDDGCGMSRDDAILAFERHATSKISTVQDLDSIRTLGFRGEALASIASVARIELTTQTEDGDATATRVTIEGGRLRDVAPAAHPRGTTFLMRDLFFNVPARRKFLRSEATESFHLTNLVTHYALAHPEIEFVLINNGRETLRAAHACDLRERAYQIFGAEFVENLLTVDGGLDSLVRVKGFTSAPRERRTSTDAQFLFVNGRFIRDKLVRRALMEGYRSVLPHGVYPAALLFLEVPFEEVDVNVHPAKTEVRFRRAAAISDAVREAIKSALARAGFVRPVEIETAVREQAVVREQEFRDLVQSSTTSDASSFQQSASGVEQARIDFVSPYINQDLATLNEISGKSLNETPKVESPEPDLSSVAARAALRRHADSKVFDSQELTPTAVAAASLANNPSDANNDNAGSALQPSSTAPQISNEQIFNEQISNQAVSDVNPSVDDFVKLQNATAERNGKNYLPPLDSAASLVREAAFETLTSDIRPIGQLAESYIIATDEQGLLLIDQHVAHERILFDKYRKMETGRAADSQQLLIPETFDLTPAQAAAFDTVQTELESYGFALMRLSGRTIAIAAVPADLGIAEARNLLTEVLETIDAEKRGRARESLRDKIAASLACRAAVKINMPLSQEKMQWLIDKLLTTSSPTTCPHGRPVILRLTMKDIERGFHRT